MITITLIGFDTWVGKDFSIKHGEQIASLFEVESSEVMYYSPEASFYNKGVDQTSWNGLVRIHCPQQYKNIEVTLAKFLIKTLQEYCVHISIQFMYFSLENCHEKINDSYPRLLKDKEIVVEKECDVEEEDIYLGNIFEGHEKKLDELYGDDDN